MLCLDNSSTMALVQLELLHQIEKATGKKITQLFQWIVASGIGGLLMLVMVYGTYVCTVVVSVSDPVISPGFHNGGVAFWVFFTKSCY